MCVCVLHKYSWWPEGVGAKGGVVGVGHKNCASGATNTFWQKRKKNKKEKKQMEKRGKTQEGNSPLSFAALPFCHSCPIPHTLCPFLIVY